MAGRANTKELWINNENIIKKSNDFSMAKLSQGLTLNQMQLLAYAIYATQQDGSTTFIKSDFEKKFDMEQYKTAHAKEDSDKIMSLKISTSDLEADSFEFVRVFRKMNYTKGTFRFEWDEDMVPHILDLKDKYIRTDLKIATKFSSGFSWTFYDYLKAHYGYWYKTLSKDALMKLFGVENKASYQKNTGLFKKKVLDIAMEEVNEYTEINVKYEEVKNGRTIVGFKLIWSTGNVIHKASEKQLDILKGIIEVILEDRLMYMKIKDDTNKIRALEIMETLQEVKDNYLNSDVGLASDKCNELTKKANDCLEALNLLLKDSGKETLKPRVPLHDWLADYRN